jgi:hypothetical protein
MSNKADAAVMDSLHGELAKVLADLLKGSINPETGQVVPPQAAVLSVARQFLKDNGIDGIAKQGTPLHNLANLPVFDEDDDNVIPLRKAQR